MKRKKFFMFLIIILLIIFILFIGVILTTKNNNKKIGEYIPEQEISEEQLRMTSVKLYFFNTEDNSIQEEIRIMDSKELLNKPEEKIINLLVSGSENDKFTNLIPNNVNITEITNEKGVIKIKFSNEIKNMESENRKNLEKIFTQTLLQLNEIIEVNLLIDEIE